MPPSLLYLRFVAAGDDGPTQRRRRQRASRKQANERLSSAAAWVAADEVVAVAVGKGSKKAMPTQESITRALPAAEGVGC